MSETLNFLKRHAFAVMWHLAYIWYVISLARSADESLQGPDSGLPYIGFTFVIVLIDILNAIFRKTDKGFYLCMGLLVVVQFVICNFI
ncbi:MAG: hypothetical protein EOP47_01305 [Sphingobacteriaceae bacterium]|nr:MAG: hypothetical protein EOP47_01305 [Sphingobacteriaceae bacterium]